jgi:uncharacterized membrane protein
MEKPMQHVEDSIEINAPVEDVFAFVTKISRAPDWIPGMVEVSNIKETKEKASYDWVYKMVGIKFKGHSERVNLRKNEGFETRTEGAIKSTWKYEFEKKGRKTLFHLSIEYEVPSKVGQKIAEKMLLRHNERELGEALHMVKDLVEYETGKAAAE